MSKHTSIIKRFTEKLKARRRLTRNKRRRRVELEAQAQKALREERRMRDKVQAAERVIDRHEKLERAHQRRVRARAAVSRPDRAVNKALSYVGVTENPPGSNRGKHIDEWQRKFSPNYIGFSWCGAFVGAMLEYAGVKGLVGSRIIYTPHILEDARRGVNGFEKLVPLDEARRGDLVLFNFPGGAGVDHVGMALGGYRNGAIETVEGNTSSTTAGSQSNGGGVFRRIRPASQIAGVARPRY